MDIQRLFLLLIGHQVFFLICNCLCEDVNLHDLIKKSLNFYRFFARAMMSTIGIGL